MMDFDELIRDKGEQAQYAYKPAAWKRFAKRAGIRPGLSGWQIAAIVAASSAVVGTSAWLLTGKRASTEQPAPAVETVASMDTVKTISETKTESVDTGVSAVARYVPEKPVAAPEPVEPASESEPPVQKTETKPTPTKQKVRSQEWLVPVHIHADTITQLEPTDEQLRQGNSRIF